VANTEPAIIISPSAAFSFATYAARHYAAAIFATPLRYAAIVFRQAIDLSPPRYSTDITARRYAEDCHAYFAYAITIDRPAD
jgi:hypothetical protein